MDKWKIALIVIGLIAAWMLLPGLNTYSPMAWVCPTCVLPNVASGTQTTFDFHFCNGVNSDTISSFNVDAEIFGPNAGSTFYCSNALGGAAKWSVDLPRNNLAPGECMDAELTIFFDENVWNAGDDYHLVLWTYDGVTPVQMAKSMFDYTYVNDPVCHAKVDAMCPNNVCTCVDEGRTKTPAETYPSFCGGVAWTFNLRNYGGSVTVSIGSVQPWLG